MAYCPNCGSQMYPNWKACPRCGASLGTTRLEITKKGSLGRAMGGMVMVAIGIFAFIGAFLTPLILRGSNPFGAVGAYLPALCCGFGGLFILVGIAMWHTSR